MIKNAKGFTLVEAIVAAGLLGALSVAGMQIMKTMSTGQVNSETKMEELELRRVISTTLTDSAACNKSFDGASIGGTINQIKNSEGNDIFKVGTTYGNGSVQITGLKTQDLNETFLDNTRMVNLVVSLQRKKGSTTGIRDLNIPIRVKAPTATGAISSCFADTNAIIEQSCLSAGGTWSGSACSFSQYVLKAGDTMTGDLYANIKGNIKGATGEFTTSTQSPSFCTGINCKSIADLALANKSCAGGFAQVGVRNDGTPECKPLQCSGTQYFAGLDSSNNPICRPYPTNTCPTNEYVAEVEPSGKVICKPIPNNTNAVCPNGYYMQKLVAGVPDCKPVSGSTTVTCPAGQVIQSINNGDATCVVAGVAPQSCGPTQIMTGMGANGTIICSELSTRVHVFSGSATRSSSSRTKNASLPLNCATNGYNTLLGATVSCWNAAEVMYPSSVSPQPGGPAYYAVGSCATQNLNEVVTISYMYVCI